MMGLKKCPFCGGEADFYQNYSDGYKKYFVTVKCEMCGAQGKVFSSERKWNPVTFKSAEKTWNTRTERSNDE